MEAKAAQENLILTEGQHQALEKAKLDKEAWGEIETLHLGYLGSQDTYYVGNLKGVGRIFQQTFIDTYAKVAFVRLYDRKNALVAADLLNQLYLAIEDIDHSKTRAKSPQSNGICERFHNTMLNEFYEVAFRKKLYRSLDEIQKDADAWLQWYNVESPHSGKYCFGKTPMQTFLGSKHLADEKDLDRLRLDALLVLCPANT